MRKRQRGMVLFFQLLNYFSAGSLLDFKIFTTGKILQLSANHQNVMQNDASKMADGSRFYIFNNK